MLLQKILECQLSCKSARQGVSCLLTLTSRTEEFKPFALLGVLTASPLGPSACGPVPGSPECPGGIFCPPKFRHKGINRLFGHNFIFRNIYEILAVTSVHNGHLGRYSIWIQCHRVHGHEELQGEKTEAALNGSCHPAHLVLLVLLLSPIKSSFSGYLHLLATYDIEHTLLVYSCLPFSYFSQLSALN